MGDDEQEKREWPAEPPRMTDPELLKWVDDFLAGRIFTSLELDQDDASMWRLVFMPLGFGAMAAAPKSYLDAVGLLWEHLSKAGPRSINGCPMFFSFHMMHKADWEIARKTCQAELERRKETKLVKP